MTQLDLFENSDTIGVAVGQRRRKLVKVSGGALAKKTERLSIDSCALCKKYYADWMRSMNTGKQAMLRKLHKGSHLHDN